ncbi:MAG: hypothetical protein ACR2PA_16235 [Hyphomicrobiaceae bacterium]
MTLNKRLSGLAMTTVVGAAFVASVSSTTAFAGNCQRVKPRVTNLSGKQITVKDLIYKRTRRGDGLTHTEGLPNKALDTGDKGTWPNQRLNHLNSGHYAQFGVKFRVRRDSDNTWINLRILKPNDEKCWDGKTVNIKIRESDIARARS